MSRPVSFARWAALGPLLATLLACSATPPTAPDAEPLPPSTPGGSEDGAAATGRFVGLEGHQVSGGVTLRVADGSGEVIFGEDFRSSTVPDPHVYVATEPDANRGTRLRIATLGASNGAQRYGFRLPAGVTYAYVLVWCDRFNVGVGAARLGNLQ